MQKKRTKYVPALHIIFTKQGNFTKGINSTVETELNSLDNGSFATPLQFSIVSFLVRG